MARRRVSVTAFASIFAWASIAIPSYAHVGNRVFPIYELPSAELPDIHDGTLEDWESVLPSSLDHNDLGTPGGQGQPLRLDDLAWRAFLAWHHASQRLYVGMEFVDDVMEGPPSGQRWAERIDFFVDGDHSGGEYFPAYQDLPIDEVSRAQRYEFALSWLPEVDALVERWVQGLLTAWSLQPPWTDLSVSSFGQAPAHSIVEAIVTPWDKQSDAPETSSRTRLEAGRFIGFQIRLLDYDDDFPESYVIGEASEGGGPTTPGFWSSASFFADGELVSCQRLDCSRGTTAAHQDSWGRIKATWSDARTDRSDSRAKRAR